MATIWKEFITDSMGWYGCKTELKIRLHLGNLEVSHLNGSVGYSLYQIETSRQISSDFRIASTVVDNAIDGNS